MIFLPFEPECWQAQGQLDGKHLFLAPDGSLVIAIAQEHDLVETRLDGQRITHNFPVWVIGRVAEPDHDDIARLGLVFRRSDAPLLDIQHALDLLDQRGPLFAPLAVWALRAPLAPGLWYLSLEEHCWIENEDRTRVPMPDLPDLLPVFIQTACILYHEETSFLALGHMALNVTVPATRHALMERLKYFEQVAHESL